MLAFEAAKKEEEQSHYSLSLLKTLPSIQSTREAKLFEKVKHRGRNETRHLEIPQINAKFASQWLLELMKKGAEGKWLEQKQFSSFIRTLFLD